jgi:hypothetical protein
VSNCRLRAVGPVALNRTVASGDFGSIRVLGGCDSLPAGWVRSKTKVHDNHRGGAKRSLGFYGKLTSALTIDYG